MDAKEVIKQVKKIEIKTKELVDSLMAGNYHSVFKGQGVEFSEVREYVPGDDVRTIDWNVTARMNHPFVKEFIEERDLTIYIVFDSSSSGEFGSKRSKKDAAVELAASVMFAAMRNNDKVGLCMFTTDVERFIPPRKGRRHVLKLIREMIQFKPSKKGTSVGEAMTFISKVAKKRSVVFVLSDFFSEGFSKPIKLLRRKHDVIAINMRDIREEELPDVGYIELEDEETGEQILLDTSDAGFRSKYTALVRERLKRFERLMQKLKIDIISIRTDEAFEVPIRRFFKERARRLSR